VHDGYSFIVGFYLIWVCYLIARAVDKLDRRRKRRSDDDGPRAELGLLVAKRGLLWLAKVGYMAFSLGIVVPILLAIVIDLYIVLPIRFSVNPGMVPRIRIVDQWALGLLYAKIGIYVQRIQPPNRISVGLQHVRFSILYLDVVLRHAVDNAAWLDTTRSNHSDEGTYCASSWRTVRDGNYSRSCIQSSVVLFPPNHAGQPVHL
jgi:hypothetical protein